ncbi:Uma2 family endonuclease [Actinomadura kijaniata]|uniref:Uma2 family endonuclease n=1 Tax=Actinomadura kijaniata TaxID=46161 RepID=UPI00082A9D7A|nr:Uma2 family endonuclease [Actinomadura kijaniata]
MTAMARETQSSKRRPSDSEGLLHAFLALEVPDGYRAELIDGEIVVSPPPNSDHEDAISLITTQVIRRSTTEMKFSCNRGTTAPSDGRPPDDHLIPDIAFTPASHGHFRGGGPWTRPVGVAMVVEVTSSNPTRDRVTKRHCYARADIPLYLLVDRDKRVLVLYSDPEGDDYRGVRLVKFGEPVPLPEPFGFELDTTEFPHMD